MGIPIQVWRARIGGFHMPHSKAKLKRPAIVLVGAALTLRVLLLFSVLCLSTTEPGPGVDAAFTPVHTISGSVELSGRLVCLSISYSNGPHVRWLLMACGDVEANPGPPKKTPKSTPATPAPGQSTLNFETGPETSKLRDLEGRLNELGMRLERVEDENRDLRQKLDVMENQSRRNNLVFYGISEEEKETWDDCEHKVKDLIANTIGVNKDVAVERAHRLGRKLGPYSRSTRSGQGADRQQGARPLIVRFETWKMKESVLRAARTSLKGTEVRVSEDYSRSVRDTRKRLIPIMLQKRREMPEERIFIKMDRLVIGRKELHIDEEGNLQPST